MDWEKIQKALRAFQDGKSPQEVAEELSVSLRTAYNLRAFFLLPEETQQMVREGKIGMAQALRHASGSRRGTVPLQKRDGAVDRWGEIIARARPAAPAATAMVRARSLADSPVGDDLAALDRAVHAIARKVGDLPYHTRESLAMVLRAYKDLAENIIRQAEHDFAPGTAGTDER